eukprot:scaffold24738_cov74-Cyclotella_meneghiniana.AAC.1
MWSFSVVKFVLTIVTVATSSLSFTTPSIDKGPRIKTSLWSSAASASDLLLYQEQEKLIVQRGELEESFITDAIPLEAPKIKIRGAGAAGGFAKSSSSSNNNKAEGKEYAKVLKKEGVVRIDNVLSSDTADALHTYLYDLRKRSEEEVAAGKIQPIQRFANVLLKHNRCDLTIPVGDELVTKALDETLRVSPIGATVSSIFGDDAILHEFSCLMSDPGSQRQVIHPDTPYIDGKGPVLYTCFIALQDVTLDMGPTVWLLRTHCKEAHEEFKDNSLSEDGESKKDSLIRKQPARLGLLKKGDCAIFDSRLLHCGSANRSVDGTSRALFYFSWKNSNVGYPGNPASIRAELGAANVKLGGLLEDLQLFSKGKGTHIIDHLSKSMK